MTDPYSELEASIDEIVTNIFVTPVGPELVSSMIEAAFVKANGAFDYRGDYEPNEVVITEPFDVMSHEDIAAKVASLKSADIETSSKNWNDLSAAATSGSDSFRTGLNAAMEAGWSGPTADAVRGGVGDYVSSAGALSTSMSLISNKLLEAHTGFEQTVSRMPPVAPSAGGTVIGSLLPMPFAAKDALSAHEEQQDEARRIMRSVYVPGVVQSDSQVPVLPTAHNPISDGGNATGGWGANPSIGAGTGSGSISSDGGIVDGRPGSSGTAPSAAEGTPQDSAPPGPGPSGSGQSQAGSPEAGRSDGLAQAEPSGETRAASAPNPGSGAAGAGAGGLGPSGVAGGGPSGSGLGGAGSTGGGTGYGNSAHGASAGGSGPGSAGYGSGGYGNAGYGGSVLGPPLASGGGAGGGTSGGPGGATTASSGRAGAHGMPGMGGMGPAGARGAGDHDSEHTTPGYLVDVSNGNDLIGDLPLVAPPVLGG